MSAATAPLGATPPNGQGENSNTQNNAENSNAENYRSNSETQNSEASANRTVVTNKHGEVVLSIPSSNPTTEDILRQLTQALADAPNGSKVNITIDGKAKKRKYTRQLPEDMNVAVQHRIKGSEFQARLAFLQTLRENAVESLVEFNSADMEGNEKALLQRHLHKRISGNMASWPNCSIDKMMIFMEDLLKRNRVISRVTDVKVIQSELREEYKVPLGTFVDMDLDDTCIKSLLEPTQREEGR